MDVTYKILPKLCYISYSYKQLAMRAKSSASIIGKLKISEQTHCDVTLTASIN